MRVVVKGEMDKADASQRRESLTHSAPVIVFLYTCLCLWSVKN